MRTRLFLMRSQSREPLDYRRPLAKLWWKATAAVLLIVFALPTAAVQACPMCGQAVASQTDGGAASGMASGYFWSILLMISAPFLLTGGFAGTLFFLARRSRATDVEKASRRN